MNEISSGGFSAVPLLVRQRIHRLDRRAALMILATSRKTIGPRRQFPHGDGRSAGVEVVVADEMINNGEEETN